MLKLARLVLRLAVIYLVLGLCLFFGFTQGFGIAPVEIAQEVIIISVAFYSFTLVELAVTTQLSHKDSSYFIGANLGFSLLRLFLTSYSFISNTKKSTSQLHFSWLCFTTLPPCVSRLGIAAV